MYVYDVPVVSGDKIGAGTLLIGISIGSGGCNCHQPAVEVPKKGNPEITFQFFLSLRIYFE